MSSQVVSPRLIFHHVGVGTTDLDGTINAYCSIGHRLHLRIDDPGLNVRVAFLACPTGEGPWIEILAPLNPGGPLQSLIARNLLPSPYHTCYRAENLHDVSDTLRLRAFFPVGEPRPALAFGNARVAFFYHRSVGLIEIVEADADAISKLGSLSRPDTQFSPGQR